jgi:hypothetical protein
VNAEVGIYGSVNKVKWEVGMRKWEEKEVRSVNAELRIAAFI